MPKGGAKFEYVGPIKTPIGRVHFMSLQRPDDSEMGRNRFRLRLIVPKSDELTKLIDEINAYAKKNWPKKKPADLSFPYLECNTDEELIAKYPWYKDKVRLSFSASGETKLPATDPMYNPTDFKFKPKQFLQDKSLGVDSSIYPGCFARLTISIGGFDEKGLQGVQLIMKSIQLIRDGERIATAEDNGECFEAVDGNAGADVEAQFAQTPSPESSDEDAL